MLFEKEFEKCLRFIYSYFQGVTSLFIIARIYEKLKSFNRKVRKDFAQSCQNSDRYQYKYNCLNFALKTDEANIS